MHNLVRCGAEIIRKVYSARKKKQEISYHAYARYSALRCVRSVVYGIWYN